jgi:hypothetical protein
VADDARLFEITASGASAAGRLGCNTRGEIKMLAPSAVDAVFMLITCALGLLICWAYVNDRAEIEAGHCQRAVLDSVTEGDSADRAGRVVHVEAAEFPTIGTPAGLASLDPPRKLSSKSLLRMIGVGPSF